MSESPLLSASSSPVPESIGRTRSKNLKRKAENIDAEASASKRASKKKKKSKSKNSGDDDIDEEHHINRAIAKMDGRLIADYIARQTKRFEPDLSTVELEDRRIPEHAFLDTSGWNGQQRDLENIAGFFESVSGKSKDALKNASKINGSPHTLVVTGAGLRAADLTRSLRVFQTKAISVAKLFAKHIKLKDAITSTKNTRMNMGVGTPRRLLDLVEQGALSLTSVEWIIIDASHINAKNRSILDMEETEVPLVQLLTHKDITSRYGKQQTRSGIKVVIY